MKKKEINFKVTHTFANDVTITDAEFKKIVKENGGFPIDLELNKEWYQDTLRALDPAYVARAAQARRIERAEKRREQLMAESLKINKALAEL